MKKRKFDEVNEELKNGYAQQQWAQPVKRYCQTMLLRDDAELIKEYRRRHEPQNVWQEIPRGMKEVGILQMEIYIHERTLFMIVETPLDFDWDTAFGRLATLERQQEWEDYMANFQLAEPGAASAEKWKLMEKMFCMTDCLR